MGVSVFSNLEMLSHTYIIHKNGCKTGHNMGMFDLGGWGDFDTKMISNKRPLNVKLKPLPQKGVM